MRKDERFSAAFTLIELLVVISIIAVLISILLPALSAARNEGQKLKCMANERAVASTAQTYASDDPNGILGVFHPADGYPFFRGGTGYAEHGGGPGLMPYGGWGTYHDPPAPTDTCPFDPRSRPLNHIIYGKNGIKGGRTQTEGAGVRGFYSVFECTGDDRGWQDLPGFGGDPKETEPTPYFTGNGVACRQNNLAYGGGPPATPDFCVGVFGRPVNRIPDPAQTLDFLEVRVYETLWTNEVTGILDPTVLTGNHKKLGWFSVSYSDGHADYKNFGKGTYYKNIQMPESQAAYQGTDARGTWGRMDCWPEPAFDPFK